MQIHQLFIYHLPLSPFIGTHSQLISLSEAGCVQLRSLEKAVMCGAQSSESPRSFLPLAIISQDQRILTSSHSLHITGHMRTPTTHHPVQTDRVFCEMWSDYPDIDIIIWRQNSIRGEPVKLDPRDVLNGRETDERV